MNVIGGSQNIINEYLNYILVIDDKLVWKLYVVKFIVFIHSITLYLLMYVVKVVLIAFGLAEMGFL